MLEAPSLSSLTADWHSIISLKENRLRTGT
jgi:hypothetical protein